MIAMIAAKIDIPLERIADFCRRWKVQEFALFGSVLRDDFGPESDVDVLYVMCPGVEEDFYSYFDMKTELEELFGRPVDLVKKKVVEDSPNWIRRKHILANYRVVYAG
ncbi:MAG TPA: nucleotidyltransferase domain-containing protein [Phycisphaerae bacterium]|nr:nucleotidyltransferase domain-containing protein [Phycisphaerae bacterium]